MKDLASIKKEKLEYVVEAVSASLQTIPFTGGVAKYLDSYFPTQQKRQIKALCEELVKHGEDIESLNCNLDHLGAIVLQAINASLMTGSEIKRSAFRALVLNYARGNIESNVVESYAHILTTLSEADILMLEVGSTVNTNGKDGFEWDTPPFVNPELPNVDPTLLWISYERLYQLKMFATKWRSLGPREAEIPLESIELSAFGHEFLQWIKSPDDDTDASSAKNR